MTERENRILELIRNNPMVTQQELATLLGIERSSVAVHISNLTKKGKIVGRGYVLAALGRVLVIGGANMDIIGKGNEHLVMADSNPGQIRMQPGGVGRNIAECLAGLKTPVKLITVLGKDAFGQLIETDARNKGIDTESVVWEPDLSTSIYVSLNHDDGDMACAVNDMACIDRLSPQKLKSFEAELALTERIVVDANLTQSTLQYISEVAKGKIFAEGVSAQKVLKLKDILDKLDTIKLNGLEAEMLSGIPVRDLASAEEAANVLLEAGVKRVVITRGQDGALIATAKGIFSNPSLATEIVNTNGAGDAFMAGVVHADIAELPVKETLLFALTCSAESMKVQGIFPGRD